MRRSLVAAFALLVLALLPLSASAAPTAQSQTFTLSIGTGSVSGSCPDLTFTYVPPITVAASGAVNDQATAAQGSVAISTSPGGRFPNQVVGTFVFAGDHSEAELVFTGVSRCLDAQTYTITGLVWTGSMIDEATGQAYAINGGGRGNSYVFTLGPGGFSVTFTGTARPMTASVVR